jgi:hypothetical protein
MGFNSGLIGLRKCIPRRVKSIRIIADADNQLPDKWSSTVVGFVVDNTT